MATITAENWRERRDELAARADSVGHHGIADHLRDVGFAETKGFPIDDAFCAGRVRAIAKQAALAEAVLS